MKIQTTVNTSTRKKEFYIDLDPGNIPQRQGPGEGNGFLGSNCLIQLEAAPGSEIIVGIRIIAEDSRDDSQYSTFPIPLATQ